jgi:hypothetical protein
LRRVAVRAQRGLQAAGNTEGGTSSGTATPSQARRKAR